MTMSTSVRAVGVHAVDQAAGVDDQAARRDLALPRQIERDVTRRPVGDRHQLQAIRRDVEDPVRPAQLIESASSVVTWRAGRPAAPRASIGIDVEQAVRHEREPFARRARSPGRRRARLPTGVCSVGTISSRRAAVAGIAR